MQKEKHITKIEKRYGDMIISMALYHLLHVGIDHIEGANMQKLGDQVRKNTEKNAILTPEIQENILCCASDLARLGCYEFLRYVKLHYPMQGTTVREAKILRFLCNATEAPILDVLIPGDTSDELLEEVLETLNKEVDRYDAEHGGDMSGFNMENELYHILCQYTTPELIAADKVFYL